MSKPEVPIVFSPESVAAIMSGPDDRPCKRQTRRVIRCDAGEDIWAGDNDGIYLVGRIGESRRVIRCPYSPGGHLWVKEAWSDGQRKRSPMFMPRAASRLSLEVISVRAERLQDISFDDCLAEGVIRTHHWHDVTCDELPEGAPMGASSEEIEASIDRGWVAYARAAFRRMWDSVNSKRGYPWQSNPWVWVIEFRRVPLPPASGG